LNRRRRPHLWNEKGMWIIQKATFSLRVGDRLKGGEKGSFLNGKGRKDGVLKSKRWSGGSVGGCVWERFLLQLQ